MSTGSSGFKGTHPGANPNSLKSELWLLLTQAELEKSLPCTQTSSTHPGWRGENKGSKWRPQHSYLGQKTPREGSICSWRHSSAELIMPCLPEIQSHQHPPS